MSRPFRIFLLSPAHSGGERAKLLLNPRAQFPLARKVRRRHASLGEVFAFLSGLYFRGKLAYAGRFARPPGGLAGVWVITSNRGLLDARKPISLAALQAFGRTPIDEGESAYRIPLERSARRIGAGTNCEAVLLGSIATGKYVDVLLGIFGERLLFPSDFIGRGDMSRGGLMLRRAASGEELPCVPVAGALRRGRRAPRLAELNPRGVAVRAEPELPRLRRRRRAG